MGLDCKFKVYVSLAIMMNVSTLLLRTLFFVHFVQHSAFTSYKPIIARPLNFAVKAKIYSMPYKQSSSIAFD